MGRFCPKSGDCQRVKCPREVKDASLTSLACILTSTSSSQPQLKIEDLNISQGTSNHVTR